MVPAPNRIARMARFFGAMLVVVFLAVGMSALGLYFLLRGDTIESSTLTRRIEVSIQRIIGPKFKVELGKTSLGFDLEGLLALESDNVKIIRTTDQQEISRLGKVIVGIKPLSLLTGDPRIDAVIVEDSTLDAALLAAMFVPDPKVGIKSVLSNFGASLGRAEAEFSASRFRLFQFRNIAITGAGIGRLEPLPLQLDRLDMRHHGNGQLDLAGELATGHSNIAFESSYKTGADASATFTASVKGINARDWVHDPASQTGQIASDALINIDAVMPFSVGGAPHIAEITIATGDASLRLGIRAVTDIHSASILLRLNPLSEQVEVGNAQLLAGALTAGFTGSLQPVDGSNWAAGPYHIALEASQMSRLPTMEGEDAVPATFKANGTYHPLDKVLAMDELVLSAGKDMLVGSASFGFTGLSPSINASVTSQGMEVAAIKQFWPFNVAPGARFWAHNNIFNGRLSNISMQAAIPAGVIGHFWDGARMQPAEFSLSADYAGVRISAFGELPPITGAAGKFTMSGMGVVASLKAGKSVMGKSGSVPIETGSFKIADIGVRPNIAKLQITTSGQAKSLAAIADAKPLKVLSRINLTPNSITGNGTADIVAEFPLKQGLAYGDVKWNAIVELKKAASTEKVFDRIIQQADLLIEATPQQVRVNGVAMVDATKTKLALVEPIGNSKVERQRSFAAELDEAARRKLGLVLDPVLSGTIKVDMKQFKDGSDKQTVDLEDAELGLPWVGWTKGRGIPANATFILRTVKGLKHLDDFYIEGTGFSASGKLVIDKNGLLRADFVDISLNDGDSFSLALERKGDAFNIDIMGLRYDARSLVNRLFHENGFGIEQGGSSVIVNANLAEVRGFNGRALKNVEMSYGAKGGWLNHLSLRGAFSNANYLNVFAATTDGETEFEIDSTDAGGSLAFTAIYGKMQGGKMRARLARRGSGPFVGQVRATEFTVENEPRIKSLVSEPSISREAGQGAANTIPA